MTKLRSSIHLDLVLFQRKCWNTEFNYDDKQIGLLIVLDYISLYILQNSGGKIPSHFHEEIIS